MSPREQPPSDRFEELIILSTSIMIESTLKGGRGAVMGRSFCIAFDGVGRVEGSCLILPRISINRAVGRRSSSMSSSTTSEVARLDRNGLFGDNCEVMEKTPVGLVGVGIPVRQTAKMSSSRKWRHSSGSCAQSLGISLLSREVPIRRRRLSSTIICDFVIVEINRPLYCIRPTRSEKAAVSTMASIDIISAGETTLYKSGELGSGLFY